MGTLGGAAYCKPSSQRRHRRKGTCWQIGRSLRRWRATPLLCKLQEMLRSNSDDLGCNFQFECLAAEHYSAWRRGALAVRGLWASSALFRMPRAAKMSQRPRMITLLPEIQYRFTT